VSLWEFLQALTYDQLLNAAWIAGVFVLGVLELSARRKS